MSSTREVTGREDERCDDCRGYTHLPTCPSRSKESIERQLINAVYRSMQLYESGEWWLDNLRAEARVKAILRQREIEVRAEERERGSRHAEAVRGLERIRAAGIIETAAALACPDGVIPPDDAEHERLTRLQEILANAALAIRRDSEAQEGEQRK